MYRKKRIFWWCFASVLWWLIAVWVFPSQASADTVVFTDDFSSGTLDKWEQVRSSPFEWQVIDGAAQVTISKGSTLSELVPKDEYWDENWHDLIYEVDYNPLAGADKNISFNFQDINNWYEIHFVGGGYEIARIKNGQQVWSVMRPYTVSNGEIVHITISIIQDQLKIYLNDLEIANDTDPTFDQSYGKIGLKAGAGNVAPTIARFDNVKVTLVGADDQKLPVPLLKQTDPRWSDLEYDTASLWSEDEPSIGRWGCALTSMAMILQYYSIEFMPDGSVLDPLTLNQWLLSQPDGYVGEGLVNWIAVSRLTHMMHSKLGTPKLEYKRVGDTSLTTSMSEIAQHKPVILEIPGHFLVADGVTSDGTDLLISDPDFSYQLLSEHEAQLVSTRTFQPSFTDLSYMLLVAKPGLEIELRHADGSDVAGVSKFESYLEAHEGDATSPEYKLIEIPQPESGEYVVTISQSDFGEFTFELYTYQVDGAVSVLSQSGMVGAVPATFKLSYNKNKPSVLTQTLTFAQLGQLFAEQKEIDGIKKWYVLRALHRLSGYAQTSSTEDQRRYINLLRVTIDRYRDKLTDESKSFLLNALNVLENNL